MKNYPENRSRSVSEYWKSPPLPFVASRDFRLDYDNDSPNTQADVNSGERKPTTESSVQKNPSPMQTAMASLAYIQDASYLNGKSSPGTSSVSSKDSGCSDPPPLAPIIFPIKQKSLRPLSAVYENDVKRSVSVENQEYRSTVDESR